MRRKPIVKKLDQLIAKLYPNLLVAGVPEAAIAKFTLDIEAKTDEQIVDYIERVTNLTIRGGAYHGFMAIYGLKPPEWWVMMSNLGHNDFREHRLLNAEAKKLRKAWKELNSVKAKPIAQPHKSEGNSEGVSVRSSES